MKLLYGRAFRAPTSTQKNTNGAFGLEIDPEIIDTYELVFMKQSERWVAELVLFKSSWKDGIVLTSVISDGVPLVKHLNIGKSNAYGVELKYQWRKNRWGIDFSSSYIKSEDDLNDWDYSAFPEYIVNLGILYQVPANNFDFYLNNRFHLDVDEGPTIDAIPDPESLDDYWRVDVHVKKGLTDRVDLFFNVKNLFDRENHFPSIMNSEGGIRDEAFSASIGIQTSF